MPPLSPGHALRYAVTSTFVLPGDAASFDTEAFRHALAAHLDGVGASDILLEVAPASVRVTSRIVTPNATFAALVAAHFPSLPRELTISLGILVRIVLPAATVTTFDELATSPPPSAPACPDDPCRRDVVLVAGSVASAAVVLVSMLAVALMWQRLRPHHSTRVLPPRALHSRSDEGGRCAAADPMSTADPAINKTPSRGSNGSSPPRAAPTLAILPPRGLASHCTLRMLESGGGSTPTARVPHGAQPAPPAYERRDGSEPSSEPPRVAPILKVTRTTTPQRPISIT